MAAITFRLHGDGAPCAERIPSGYATVPKRITRRTDLRVEKLVLTAILGLCWGDKRRCAASVNQIGQACGMPRRTVQRHLDTLIEAGLIDRRPDEDAPGGPWITYVLTDPKGLDDESDTLRHFWRTPSL